MAHTINAPTGYDDQVITPNGQDDPDYDDMPGLNGSSDSEDDDPGE